MRRVVVRRKAVAVELVGARGVWESSLLVWEVRCPCGVRGLYLRHDTAVAVAHQMGLTHAMEAALARDCE